MLKKEGGIRYDKNLAIDCRRGRVACGFISRIRRRSGRATPAPAPIIMPVYNWTGFYIGANLGGAWANGTLTDNLTGASFSGTHSGVLGGGTLGYNWQVSPNFVVGFEGTFDGTSISNTSNIEPFAKLSGPV